MKSPLEQLTDEIHEVALLVHSAQERAEDREIVTSAHLAVDRLSQHYRELASDGPESERDAIERKFGRRVTDLRRMASTLPRIGAIASGHTGDQANAGPSRVQERRITGVSWRSEAVLGAALPPALRVGGEVDAWCGPCDGLTTHHIIAMVDQTPKQVVCQACGGRHGFRTTPARKSAAESAKPTTPKESEAVRKAEQKAEELRASDARWPKPPKCGCSTPVTATKWARLFHTRNTDAARWRPFSGPACSCVSRMGA